MGDGLHRIFINDTITKDGKKAAVKVGKYLCVSYTNKELDTETYMIYSIITNRPVLPTRINNFQCAMSLAHWINEVYDEYLELYEACPGWDILQIARLSVPDGEDLYQHISEWGEDIIGLEQLERAKQKANEQ